LRSTPDRPHFAAAPAIDAIVGPPVPGEASAQHPGSEAPAGLAFTARAVPMPAAEVEASATRAAGQFQTSKAIMPDRAETPALRAPHFSNDPQKEDPPQVTVWAPGSVLRVVPPLAPASTVDTPIPTSRRVRKKRINRSSSAAKRRS
jgi:hypothetical protein